MMAEEAFVLKESELPFKVRRVDRPKTRFMKRPKDVKSSVDGTYFPATNKIEIYKPMGTPEVEEIAEHEVAHYQLRDRRTAIAHGIDDEMEGEIQADLVSYARNGIQKEWKSRLDGILSTGLDSLEDWNVGGTAKVSRALGHIKHFVKQYWQWLPPQWKTDYDKFLIELRRDIRESLAERMKAKGTLPEERELISRAMQVDIDDYPAHLQLSARNRIGAALRKAIKIGRPKEPEALFDEIETIASEHFVPESAYVKPDLDMRPKYARQLFDAMTVEMNKYWDKLPEKYRAYWPKVKAKALRSMAKYEQKAIPLRAPVVAIVSARKGGRRGSKVAPSAMVGKVGR